MGRPPVCRREGAGIMTEAEIFIGALRKPTEAELEAKPK
jgi:hypothetical protein